jgi:hypothetical protein
LGCASSFKLPATINKDHYGQGDAAEDVDGLDAGDDGLTGSVDRDVLGLVMVVVLMTPRKAGKRVLSIFA